jgi:hypothetical protein
MLLISVGTLAIAMIGGARVVYEIFGSSTEESKIGIFAPVVMLGVAYGVGWLTAMVGIRVYGNLILPILINVFMWVCLAGICYLYLEIIVRLLLQEYDLWRFLKYVVVMLAGLAALIGLHLINEDHNLRPFAIPLLIMCVIQLGLDVYRYVFIGGNAIYLLGDLFFLFGMAGVAIMMLAHVGLLDPLRTRFTNYFDMNSTSIRTQD